MSETMELEEYMLTKGWELQPTTNYYVGEDDHSPPQGFQPWEGDDTQDGQVIGQIWINQQLPPNQNFCSHFKDCERSNNEWIFGPASTKFKEDYHYWLLNHAGFENDNGDDVTYYELHPELRPTN